MWIVRLALDRPYTFVVLAVLILLLGSAAAITTPVDIFPKIDIPIITIIWTYNGLPTTEMEHRVTTFSEYSVVSENRVTKVPENFDPEVSDNSRPANLREPTDPQAISVELRGVHPMSA